MKKCHVEGCARSLNGRKTFCAGHYMRLLKTGSVRAHVPLRQVDPMGRTANGGVCIVVGCKKPTRQQRLCSGHWERKRLGKIDWDGPLKKRRQKGQPKAKCSVSGCNGFSVAKDFCEFHYNRWSAGRPFDAKKQAKKGEMKLTNKHGYIVVSNGPRGVLEHRVVMEKMIGRKLLRQESVHHKNGIRNDNRPENLELWTKRQLAGQRAIDLLRWAREIIDQYEPIELLLS